MRNKKIHNEPLSQDLENLEVMTEEEIEELDFFEEEDGEWATLTDEELTQLERPDHGYTIEDWYGEPLWSEILPNLWQGGTAGSDETINNRRPNDLSRISKEDFDTVVTMYSYAQAAGWHVKELRHGIYDSDMRDFDPTDLFDIVRTAHADWKKGKKVLIRCQAGWNRSGLVMGLVLIRDGMPAEDAVKIIRARRSRNALCNSHFVDYLMKQNSKDWQGESYGKSA